VTTPSLVRLRVARLVIEDGLEPPNVEALSVAIQQQVASLWNPTIAWALASAGGPHAALAGAVATTIQQRLDRVASPDTKSYGDGRAR
jgi:hypothetical protein